MRLAITEYWFYHLDVYKRQDLIRSGKFVEKALAVRAEMTEMVNDLQRCV